MTLDNFPDNDNPVPARHQGHLDTLERHPGAITHIANTTKKAATTTTTAGGGPQPKKKSVKDKAHDAETENIMRAILRTRKSWKTVKGNTEAVWPPHLEAALLKGLQEYVPEDSRETRVLGRFPMRNRFISDYILRTTGKTRTAKQVGSRLQQLRDTSEGRELMDWLTRSYHTNAKKGTNAADQGQNGSEGGSPLTNGVGCWDASGPLPSQDDCDMTFPLSPLSPTGDTTSPSSSSSTSSDRSSESPISPVELSPFLSHAVPHKLRATPPQQAPAPPPPVATSVPAPAVDDDNRTHVYIDIVPSTHANTLTGTVSASGRGTGSCGPRTIRTIDPTLAFVAPGPLPVDMRSSFIVLLDGAPIHSEIVSLRLVGPSGGGDPDALAGTTAGVLDSSLAGIVPQQQQQRAQASQAQVAHSSHVQGVQETSVGGAHNGGHGPEQLLYGTTLVPKFWHEIRDSPDPTQYSIIQDVHRVEAASVPHGLSRRRRSVLVFSAIYHFRYPSSVVLSPNKPDVIGLGLDLGLSLGTAFDDTSFAPNLGGVGLVSSQQHGQGKGNLSSAMPASTPPLPSFDQTMEGMLDVNLDDLIFSDDFIMSAAAATQNTAADAATSPTQFFTEDFSSYFPH